MLPQVQVAVNHKIDLSRQGGRFVSVNDENRIIMVKKLRALE